MTPVLCKGGGWISVQWEWGRLVMLCVFKLNRSPIGGWIYFALIKGMAIINKMGNEMLKTVYSKLNQLPANKEKYGGKRSFVCI
jgi:hypothetical protein